jgi:dienelactone hydrolase
MKYLTVSVLLLCIGLITACKEKPDIRGEPVEYVSESVVMKGFLAYDNSISGKRPGVLVVHEWWGHNEYARSRARMLAELGYTALAVDMYGEGRQAQHPDDAGTFANEVRQNMDVGKARFLSAMDVLKEHPTVDPDSIAAIGYCFGGGIVLHMARSGVDLDGVVSFHGGLSTEGPALPGGVTAKVLVCHGADDGFIPPDQVEDFRKEMEEAEADFRIISYAGATHSFTNPDADSYAAKFNIPVAYNAEADTKSWADMQDFLKEVFRKEKSL